MYCDTTIAIIVKSTSLDRYSKKIIENRLISLFSKKDNYNVVERTDLPAIITERQFQQSFAKNSPSNSFAGADQILICSILQNDNQCNINLKIEMVNSGIVLAAIDFFRIQIIIQ